MRQHLTQLIVRAIRFLVPQKPAPIPVSHRGLDAYFRTIGRL